MAANPTKSADNLIYKLSALMKARQMSAHDLARASGVAQTQISNILARRTGCTARTADKLAAVFGLAGAELFSAAPLIDPDKVKGLRLLTSVYISGSDQLRNYLDEIAKRESGDPPRPHN